MIELPMTEAQFATATTRLRQNGIELTGPAGKLRINILEKPFLLPESLIEGRLKAYLEQSLAAG